MKISRKTVLVTGATGFIGSAVVTELTGREHLVRCFVRHTSDISFLDGSQNDLSIRYGDLCEKDTLEEAMKGCDWLLNCAGLNTFWQKDKRSFYRVNEEGTRNVMEAALKTGVKKVVHVSTVMAYGFPEDSPFREDSKPGPHVSHYARSKYRGDQIAAELHNQKGLPLVMVYLAAVVGKGDKKTTMQIGPFLKGKVPAMIGSAHLFTYVYVKDAARAIVRAAEKEMNIGEKYLIGNQVMATREYFQMISDIAGVPMPRYTIGKKTTLFLSWVLTSFAKLTGRPPLMPLDLMRTVYESSLLFDAQKAETELGIKHTPIRKALEEAVADIRGPSLNE